MYILYLDTIVAIQSFQTRLTSALGLLAALLLGDLRGAYSSVRRSGKL